MQSSPAGHHPACDTWRKGNRKVKGEELLRRRMTCSWLLWGYFREQAFALGTKTETEMEVWGGGEGEGGLKLRGRGGECC